MEDPAIDRVIRYMATHTQVRIPALSMPDHTRAVVITVDIQVVNTVVATAVITAVITAAGIPVTKNRV